LATNHSNDTDKTKQHKNTQLNIPKQLNVINTSFPILLTFMTLNK